MASSRTIAKVTPWKIGKLKALDGNVNLCGEARRHLRISHTSHLVVAQNPFGKFSPKKSAWLEPFDRLEAKPDFDASSYQKLFHVCGRESFGFASLASTS